MPSPGHFARLITWQIHILIVSPAFNLWLSPSIVYSVLFRLPQERKTFMFWQTEEQSGEKKFSFPSLLFLPDRGLFAGRWFAAPTAARRISELSSRLHVVPVAGVPTSGIGENFGGQIKGNARKTILTIGPRFAAIRILSPFCIRVSLWKYYFVTIRNLSHFHLELNAAIERFWER